jgi:hypothetical protein
MQILVVGACTLPRPGGLEAPAGGSTLQLHLKAGKFIDAADKLAICWARVETSM